MINFAPDLITGKSLKWKRMRTVRRIKLGKNCNGVFVISSPANPENLYEINEAGKYFQARGLMQEVTVYAIAGTMKEAREILLNILEKRYADT